MTGLNIQNRNRIEVRPNTLNTTVSISEEVSTSCKGEGNDGREREALLRNNNTVNLVLLSIGIRPGKEEAISSFHDSILSDIGPCHRDLRKAFVRACKEQRHARLGRHFSSHEKSEKASVKSDRRCHWHHHDYRVKDALHASEDTRDNFHARETTETRLLLSVSWLLIHSLGWLPLRCSWHRETSTSSSIFRPFSSQQFYLSLVGFLEMLRRHCLQDMCLLEHSSLWETQNVSLPKEQNGTTHIIQETTTDILRRWLEREREREKKQEQNRMISYSNSLCWKTRKCMTICYYFFLDPRTMNLMSV